MNEEEKNITTTEPAAEKQTKPAKPKRTDEEKLQECYNIFNPFFSLCLYIGNVHAQKREVISFCRCIQAL